MKKITLLLHIFLTTVMLPAQNTSLPVGAIPGAIDVSPMGAATYTIPIEVVPGTQGVQPNLSIVYNSMSGMGLLGMKWSLAGLSAITLCGQIPYYDNNITGIKFGNGGRFALDGERLVRLSSGDYGDFGGKYAIEIENFMRMLSHGEFYPIYNPLFPFLPPSQIPITTHFTAYTDDGTIIEYGHTDDSKQKLWPGSNISLPKILSWYIKKITDANGNYMTYHYGGGGGSEIWIDSIKYTGNANSPTITPYAKVKFEYTTLSNTMGNNTYYVSGLSIPQTKLLSSITVCYGNTTVRKYQFYYNENDTGERTLHLKKIVLTEYGESGIEQLNPTLIEWGDKSISLTQKPIDGLPNGDILTGDFNGDGYTDIVVYRLSTSSPHIQKWEVYLYDPLTNSYNYKTSGIYNEGYNSTTESTTSTTFYAHDINGDGKDELIFLMKTTFSSGSIQSSLCVFSADVDPPVPVSGFGFDHLADENVYFGDFDGDGKTDVLVVKKEKENNKNDKYTLYVSGMMGGDIGEFIINNKYNLLVKMLDANGNGKQNILVYNNDTYAYNIYQYQVSDQEFVIHSSGVYQKYSAFGDVNGDGITDILVPYFYNNLYWWKILMAKGNGDFIEYDIPAALNTEGDNLGLKYLAVLADLNGDGKDDIIQPVYNSAKDSTTFNILLSNGWENDIYHFTIREIKVKGQYNTLDLLAGDFSGSGKVDLLLKRSKQEPVKIISMNLDKDYEFVKAIEDGMGKKIQLNYQHKYFLAKSSYWIPIFKYPRKKSFLPIVDFIKVSNGIGNGLNTLQYRYHNAVYSVSRRKFLGFEQFISVNNQENKKDSCNFLVDSVKHILISTTQTSYCGNQKTSEKSSHVVFDNLPHGRFAVNYSKIEDYNWLSNTYSEINNTLDNVGRLTQSNTKIYNACNAPPNNWIHSETKNYTYNTITLNDKQKKTVPTQILTTQQYQTNGIPSPIIADTLTYDYYTNTQDNGRLKWQRQGNIDGCITTTYSNYAPAGLAGLKSISAPGCTTRTEALYYDYTQRFVLQVWNPSYHTTIFTYDEKTGNKKSEKDPNLLTTSYQYDTFGNLKKITYPDGTETIITMDWYSDSHLPDAKYKIETVSEGKPTVTVYYDVLGREICRRDDGYLFKTIYNTKGQVEKTMGPHGAFNSPESEGITHTYFYDNLGRKSAETAPYTNLSYSYNDRKVTVTHNGVSSWKDYDALGRMVAANDLGGTINYSYAVITENSKPRHQTTITSPGATTLIKSDLWGNRLSINEPNAGVVTSEYNKFNELATQTDARGNITTYSYDLLGRITRKQYTGSGANLLTTYIYDYFSSTNKGVGKIFQIQVNNITEETFIYDNLSRLEQYEKVIDNTPYTFHYDYTQAGQLQTLTYPDGFEVTYSYTSTGKLNEIRRTDGNNNSLIYRVISRNMYNLPSKCEYGNELLTEYSYNTYGVLTRIKTGNKVYYMPMDTLNQQNDRGGFAGLSAYVDSAILNYRYAYNTKGLMSSRSESVINRVENYTYDNLDRLTKVTCGAAQQTFSYYNNGNISNNSQVGSYSYGSKPHAVTNIQPINNNVISQNRCDVTYNFFNQPTGITEGSYFFDISYGSNQQRNRVIKYGENGEYSIHYYINKYYETEKLIRPLPSDIRTYHYIYGDNGIVAMHVENNPYYFPHGDSIFYIHTDHLGSYCAVTSPSKQVVMRNHFDPWGNYVIRNFIPILPNTSITHRGFTGHEHYPELKIINMNGRLYDPVIGRFFSPDKYVANSSFTQDFNRYTYARNNPLAYTDPSGEFIWWVPLVIGAVQGAIQGAILGAQLATQKGATGGEWAKCFFAGFGMGIAMGIGSAYASAGLGYALGAAGIGGAIGGGIIGAATGPANGALTALVTGGIMGTKGDDLRAAVKRGAWTGTINGFANGFVMGGLQAKLEGRDFLTGSIITKGTPYSQPIPPVSSGQDQCVLDGLVAIDRSFGLNHTRAELAECLVPSANGLPYDIPTWENYAEYIGRAIDFDCTPAEALTQFGYGARVAVTLDQGDNMPHEVILNSYQDRTIERVNGFKFYDPKLRIMDPGSSVYGYRKLSWLDFSRTGKNGNNIFVIY